MVTSSFTSIMNMARTFYSIQWMKPDGMYCTGNKNNTDPMTRRLLSDDDLGLAVLGEEVMVHGPVLIPLDIHQSQSRLVHSLPETSHVVTVFSLSSWSIDVLSFIY